MHLTLQATFNDAFVKIRPMFSDLKPDFLNDGVSKKLSVVGTSTHLAEGAFVISRNPLNSRTKCRREEYLPLASSIHMLRQKWHFQTVYMAGVLGVVVALTVEKACQRAFIRRIFASLAANRPRLPPVYGTCLRPLEMNLLEVWEGLLHSTPVITGKSDIIHRSLVEAKEGHLGHLAPEMCILAS